MDQEVEHGIKQKYVKGRRRNKGRHGQIDIEIIQAHGKEGKDSRRHRHEDHERPDEDRVGKAKPTQNVTDGRRHQQLDRHKIKGLLIIRGKR